MKHDPHRRDLLKLMGLGGVVFASNLLGCTTAGSAGSASSPTTSHAGLGPGADDFFFLQLSDTHWGYQGPANPQADQTLPKVVQTINHASRKPDFIVFTGDLTHTTDDAKLRRSRMAEFKRIVSELDVKDVHFLAGEHDASIDHGEAFQEHFGATHYSFDHKGVHFVALDNVSDPQAHLGDAQLDWLQKDLAQLSVNTPLVVFAHRPLFDLMPQWDWATPDGAKAIEILSARPRATVFYGHIHQEHHRQTGVVAHHSARSLVFALPAPGSVPKKAPVPWDPAVPFKGLGYRSIASHPGSTDPFQLEEHGVES